MERLEKTDRRTRQNKRGLGKRQRRIGRRIGRD
jgi:hypothetical protein